MERREFMKLTSGGAAGVLVPSGAHSRPEDSGIREDHPENSGLPYRQVHLDFHTSRHIEGIGSDFDPEEFVSTLKNASVNSITCFGRCHHGFIYYDTEKFKERRHPHLERNLLNEQIEVCHKNNIRVPIYVTIQWDFYTSQRNKDWLIRNEVGDPIGSSQFEPGFYTRLCVNSPYKTFLKESIGEMFEKVPVDGLFLDIVKDFGCSCQHCQASMRKGGFNPEKPEDRIIFGEKMMKDFKEEMTGFIKKLDKDCSIFYNGGHIGPDIRRTLDSYTHLELESLPSGSWGYLHFPLTARYARTLGKEILGMTGKFHTTWGDFHSFKNRAALEFECFNMLAQGAKCSVGDQLLPGGKIDKATYDLIGSVYNRVEQKEPWCYEANALTDIGVISPEEFQENKSRVPNQAKGAVRILQEGNQQFDIIDSSSNFALYKAIILPDTIPVEGELAAKLDRYAASGRSVIATFESGLDPDKNDFSLECLGVKKAGDGPQDSKGELAIGRIYGRNNYTEYLIPTDQLAAGLDQTEHAMYAKGLPVTTNAEVLLYNTASYYDRTLPDFFCSHRQTPSSGERGAPAIVKNGNCLYFSHPIFSGYNQRAPRWYKRLFLNALDLVLEPLVKIEGPTTITCTINRQESVKRSVLHLLHYIPEARGEEFDVLEDVIPIYGIQCSIRNDHNYSKARLVPENKSLEVASEDGRISFTVHEVMGHQMIELS